MLIIKRLTVSPGKLSVIMPKAASKILDFGKILPKSTYVYIAHLEGTPISDMVATAKILQRAGFNAIPHFPARIIENKTILEDWIKKYRSVGVNKALIIAGSSKKPLGDYSNSMEILSTGFFEKYDFVEIFCAGHPEGNRDIDPDYGEKNVMSALKWKKSFAEGTNIKISLTTQFCFEIKPIIEWEKKLAQEDLHFPINIGLAGPAKLQTMIKYAILCGVGPSLRVLEKRAKDLTQLILPYTPRKLIDDIVLYKKINKNSNINHLHFFPLGGITNTTTFLNQIKNNANF